MASAEMLTMTHSINNRVMGVDEGVKDVQGTVQDIRGGVQDVGREVQDVGNEVRAVDDRVQDVGRDLRGDVQDVGNKVQGVDDKLDQANRSLSLYLLLIFPSAQTVSQGISSEIAFSDGSRLQIHQSIITSHLRLITRVRPNGFFKGVYSINGNPPAPFCGYMESVRFSLSSPCGNP